MRVAGILRVPTMHSRDILFQAKGDHLDRVHSDQMVLEMIRLGREASPVEQQLSGGQEFQNKG
jgi:hypothetical protein